MPYRDFFFSALAEAAMTAIIAVDAEGKIVAVNRKTEELFGHDRNSLLGAPIERLIPERYRTRHQKHVASFLAEPSARPMGAGRELFGVRANGEEFPVEIGLSPFVSMEGAFTLASIIDITLRRQAEADQARLAAIVSTSHDAIISKTMDGIITSWNAAAQSMFGYSAEEAIGQPISLITPIARLAEGRDLLQHVARGDHVKDFETQRQHRDGSVIEVALTTSPLFDQQGAPMGVSTILRDITLNKQRDAELLRSNAELEQFAYVASHDLQEPLRMVANYVELLADRYRGKLDERADKYVGFASDGARRMQLLVADLLAYSRVGSQGKAFAPVETGTVVDRVTHALGGPIAQSGAIVERGHLPCVNGDETQLDQLVQNLIGNAIKFRSEAPPRIRIAARPKGRQWLFSVSDNGIGIDQRHADRIFQMFQRLNGRDKYDGSGIGLAIAKRIVERHNGIIWVEPETGIGSTFYFTLDACPGDEPW
jgi:PAS domain S-box-containing protein